MIKGITVTNHLGESLRIDLFNPEGSGFIIENIDGLGPPKANVNFTELATNDGAIDNSAFLETRNIVLSLRFLENPTIEATRLLTYKYFPIKRTITFLIETDRRNCMITGRVESNEPDIFSEEEGCQISILCPDPYFYSVQNNGTIFFGVRSLFEFPFSNESLTENLIEFGTIQNQTEASVFYDGDAEVGMIIRIHILGDVEGVTIYSLRTKEVLKINDERLEEMTGSGLVSGDEITFTTTRGNKGLSLLRNGITTNIINVLDKPISWFQLAKGENIFIYMADRGLSNIEIQIENKVVYEGV